MLTVKDIMEQLSKLDQNMPVYKHAHWSVHDRDGESINVTMDDPVIKLSIQDMEAMTYHDDGVHVDKVKAVVID